MTKMAAKAWRRFGSSLSSKKLELGLESVGVSVEEEGVG